MGAFLALLLIGAAQAESFRVTPDEGDYPTIASALAEAQPLDVVEVASGHYVESVVVPSGVTLEAADGAVVRLTGARTDAPAVVLGAGATLRGLTVYGGLPNVDYAWSGATLEGFSLEDVRLEHSRGSAVRILPRPPTWTSSRSRSAGPRSSNPRMPASKSTLAASTGRVSWRSRGCRSPARPRTGSSSRPAEAFRRPSG